MALRGRLNMFATKLNERKNIFKIKYGGREVKTYGEVVIKNSFTK